MISGSVKGLGLSFSFKRNLGLSFFDDCGFFFNFHLIFLITFSWTLTFKNIINGKEMRCYE